LSSSRLSCLFLGPNKNGIGFVLRVRTTCEISNNMTFQLVPPHDHRRNIVCITVKLVHTIMRVFYSHSFAFWCACNTRGVANGGMFCHMWNVCQKGTT
jgi:hypothetical protein